MHHTSASKGKRNHEHINSEIFHGYQATKARACSVQQHNYACLYSTVQSGGLSRERCRVSRKRERQATWNCSVAGAVGGWRRGGGSRADVLLIA